MVDQPGCDLPDEDLTGARGRLELRGDPDGLAGDEALACFGGRGDDLPRLDADADLETHAALPDELIVERGDSSLDVEGGTRSAQRVVLVRDRDSEGRHDSIARELLDHASVPCDRRRDRLEVALKDTAERFGIECFGERHGLDDVDEEKRDEPPELHRRAYQRSLLEQQRVVLPQNRGLELAKLRAGIDAELVDEGLPRRAVRRKRVRLPPRAVERKHELGPWALAERLCADERLELRDELAMTTQGEVGVDALLEDDRPQLLESCDLGLSEGLVQEVRQRRAAPERERVAQRALGRGAVPSRERGPPFLCQPGEAVEVDALGLQLELVAGSARGDDLPQSLSKLRDIDLDGVGRCLGRIARPERLDQLVDRDDAARLERERRQERAWLRPSESDRRSLPRDLGRAEEAYLEHWGACLARSLHQSVLGVVCARTFSCSRGDCHPPGLSRS